MSVGVPLRVWVWGERGGTCLVGSLLSLFSFCGADDGSRTRCLHLGVVALYLLGFIRMSRRPALLAAFVCLGARGGACFYSSRLRV